MLGEKLKKVLKSSGNKDPGLEKWVLQELKITAGTDKTFFSLRNAGAVVIHSPKVVLGTGISLVRG